MTLTVPALAWQATVVNRAPQATVPIDFGSDPNWNVSLIGTLDGVYIQPRWVTIDNTANSAELGMLLGGNLYVVKPFQRISFRASRDNIACILQGTTGTANLIVLADPSPPTGDGFAATTVASQVAPINAVGAFFSFQPSIVGVNQLIAPNSFSRGWILRSMVLAMGAAGGSFEAIYIDTVAPVAPLDPLRRWIFQCTPATVFNWIGNLTAGAAFGMWQASDAAALVSATWDSQ